MLVACTAPLGHSTRRAYRLVEQSATCGSCPTATNVATIFKPPLCKKEGASAPQLQAIASVARLAVTEGLFYYVLPRVQSLSRFATAPFTQGSLRCGGNYAKLKLFGTTSTAGGFRLTIKKGDTWSPFCVYASLLFFVSFFSCETIGFPS